MSMIILLLKALEIEMINVIDVNIRYIILYFLMMYKHISQCV